MKKVAAWHHRSQQEKAASAHLRQKKAVAVAAAAAARAGPTRCSACSALLPASGILRTHQAIQNKLEAPQGWSGTSVVVDELHQGSTWWWMVGLEVVSELIAAPYVYWNLTALGIAVKVHST